MKSREIISNETWFDYALLDPSVADAVRAGAERIRKYGKKSLKDVVVIGEEFKAIQAALTGRFNRWLRAEVGWTKRTATNFMSVATWLGGEVEIISTLAIQPTAALELAAPSVLEEARQQALQRARAGEKITTAIAEEIIAAIREKHGLPVKSSHARLRGQLESTLDKSGKHWATEKFCERAQEMLDYVDSLIAMRENGRVVDVGA